MLACPELKLDVVFFEFEVDDSTLLLVEFFFWLPLDDEKFWGDGDGLLSLFDDSNFLGKMSVEENDYILCKTT